ncbi:MAG: DUF5916 domain-containing protein [Vicinamibacterales bacterium]
MMRPSRWAAAFLAPLVLLALPAIALAQSPTRSEPDTASPVANAARREAAVTIDGRLDEAAWQAARASTEFRQSQPKEGLPASLSTEVRVLYDDEALYIGARMTQPGGVVAPLARRDQLLDADGDNGSFNSLTTDKLIIRLDPYHNHLDDVWFEVNPAGVKGDQFNGDPSWDPIWDAAAQVDSDGWTVEMRIPFSQLRFSREAVQSWGLQVWRYIDRLNEQVMWSFRRRDEPGGPAFFGHLAGLEISRQPRQLELLPYVVTGSTFKHAERGDPFHDSRDMRFGFGGDLKYLLTSNLTLDATFNPDFGQVEVDPSVLNLSAFETFYDEKRPFFIAGASAFRFGGMRCFFCSNTSSLSAFYSRRIGRPPQLAGYLDEISSFAETPDNVTIIGAAKITGRTQGGYTVGILNAVTGPARASYLPDGGGQEATQLVEPLTNYFVGRVKKEFRGGATTFGGVLTSTARQLGDLAARARLRSHAEAAGFDWNHTWRGRQYSWMGTTMVSSVSGSPEAIALTQRSSAHYFQRPDRSATGDGLFDTRYDPSATSLQGYGLYTRVGKDAGGVLRWEAMANIRSPGFEVNDLSFLSRADFKWFNGNIAGSWTVPTRWYRSIFASFGGATEYNYDGDRTWSQLQGFYGHEFSNYWNLRVIGIHNFISHDHRLTRGGPVVKRAGYDYGSVGISTDARSPAVFDVEVEMARGVGDDTTRFGLRPGVALKPASNIFIQLSPSYSRDENAAQYVTAVADPTAAAFSGNRYVFGYIRTRTVSLDTRVNWTFTPDLTLQLFAQPFIASGQYESFREFAAPRSLSKLVYGKDLGTISYDGETSSYRVDPDGPGPASPFTFDNPDFTTASLRGTAVLRWEYRPGSTLYLVWTHERSDLDPAGSFDFAGAGRAIFRGRPTNVFQVKATYWFGR